MKSQREEELEGGWYTEERMERDLGYSKSLARNLTQVADRILLRLSCLIRICTKVVVDEDV